MLEYTELHDSSFVKEMQAILHTSCLHCCISDWQLKGCSMMAAYTSTGSNRGSMLVVAYTLRQRINYEINY